jgi:hypothetical protein
LSYKKKINEMDISNLFKDSHRSINEDDIVLYQDVNPENAQEIADYMGMDIDYIFYDENSFLHRVFYWKDEIYIAFFGFPIPIANLEFMKTREGFLKLSKHFTMLKSNKQYDRLFMMMEKKVIIPMFNKLYTQIPVKDRYDIFIDIYVRSEYGFTVFNPKILKDVFNRRKFSSEWKERMEVFKKKTKGAETVTIYRGEGSMSTHIDDALSWTLSRTTANFFAKRFGSRGKVHKKVVSVDLILDYLNNRNENEVLLKIG